MRRKKKKRRKKRKKKRKKKKKKKPLSPAWNDHDSDRPSAEKDAGLLL